MPLISLCNGDVDRNIKVSAKSFKSFKIGMVFKFGFYLALAEDRLTFVRGQVCALDSIASKSFGHVSMLCSNQKAWSQQCVPSPKIVTVDKK